MENQIGFDLNSLGISQYDPELFKPTRPSEALFNLLKQLDVDKDTLDEIKKTFSEGATGNGLKKRQNGSDGQWIV